MRYEVQVTNPGEDAVTVWSDDVDTTDATMGHFPAEFKARPEHGTVTLIIGDDIVGVQVSEEDEAAEMAANLTPEQIEDLRSRGALSGPLLAALLAQAQEG